MAQPVLCATVGPVQHMYGGLARDEAELTFPRGSGTPPFLYHGSGLRAPASRWTFSDLLVFFPFLVVSSKLVVLAVTSVLRNLCAFAARLLIRVLVDLC